MSLSTEARIELTAARAGHLLKEEIASWAEIGVKTLPSLVVAIIIFVVFLFLARLISDLSRRVFQRTTTNAAAAHLLEFIISAGIVCFGGFICLGVLRLEKTVASLLAGAGIIGLALGLAFQEITSNLLSGIIIAFTQPYKVNDLLRVNDITGRVDAIHLRTTNLRTSDGQIALIPNKDMLSRTLVNFSKTGKRTAVITVRVSYGENLDRVTDIVKEAMQNVTERDTSQPVGILFKEFGEFSVNFDVSFWLKSPVNDSHDASVDDAIRRIKRAFDANGIVIPSLVAPTTAVKLTTDKPSRPSSASA